MTQMVVAGNRPQKLGGWNNRTAHRKIYKYIYNELEHEQPELVYTGMALGIDQWAADACIKLNIPFVACIPFEYQSSKWSVTCQNEYNRLIKRAAKVVYVDRELGYIDLKTAPDIFSSTKIITRNKYMIDQLQEDDVLLAICAINQHSGTRATVDYARSSRRDIRLYLISPETIVPGLLYSDDDIPF